MMKTRSLVTAFLMGGMLLAGSYTPVGGSISTDTTLSISAKACQEVGYVSVKSCNLRSTPDKSTSKNIITTLSKGTEFSVLDYDGYWYKIKCSKGTGYVSHKMVTFSDYYYEDDGCYGGKEDSCATAGRVTASSACNLRSTPDKSTSKNIITTLKKGTKFTVLSYDGYWYKIKCSKGTGYVSHKMVEVW